MSVAIVDPENSGNVLPGLRIRDLVQIAVTPLPPAGIQPLPDLGPTGIIGSQRQYGLSRKDLVEITQIPDAQLQIFLWFKEVVMDKIHPLLPGGPLPCFRSEEHTSELQSRPHL